MSMPKHSRTIIYFDRQTRVWCDGKCEKAWGINGRNYHPDDTMFTDEEMVGDAPANPGTYEGRDAKPTAYPDPNKHVLNKWCIRECERCEMLPYEDAV